MHNVTIPKMGMATLEVDVVAWHVRVGDTVTAGMALAELESEKATMDLESPCDGVVEALMVSEGDSIAPGAVVCTIRETG